MARYNTSLPNKTITGTTTIVTPDSGAFVQLAGTAPYTVTLPVPSAFPGSNFTFYNATIGTVTLSTPSGAFNGTGGSAASTVSIFAGNVVSVTSDGTNYIVISEDGSPLIATTGSFSSNVDVNGTLTVNPSGGVSMSPSTVGSINNVTIGGTTRATGSFTALTANGATTFTANTPSTTSSSGTVVITGGLGVSGTINAASVNASLTGTIQTASQPNITSVGTLSGLTVTNTITGSISGSAATVTNASQPAITSLGTLSGLTVTNTITGSVSGSAATVTAASQPNITSVGTLSGLTVSGTLTGNLTGTHTNTYSTPVTDYRTTSPSSTSILLVGTPNDRDAWIYRDPAGGATNWGIYHRNVDSTIASLPANSIGFIGSNQLAGYVDLQNRTIRSMTAMDQPYQMVVRTGGYTVPSGITDIVFDVLVHSRYMSHNSGNNMIFDQPGKYQITTGWRLGAGGDVWTGVRLLDIDGTVRGLGYGTGQVNGNDPGPCEITFIADIPASRVGQNMRMQFMRLGSTMGIATPASGYGYAIVTTVIQVGV